jgi:hypothetical protein
VLTANPTDLTNPQRASRTESSSSIIEIRAGLATQEHRRHSGAALLYVGILYFGINWRERSVRTRVPSTRSTAFASGKRPRVHHWLPRRVSNCSLVVSISLNPRNLGFTRPVFVAATKPTPVIEAEHRFRERRREWSGQEFVDALKGLVLAL